MYSWWWWSVLRLFGPISAHWRSPQQSLLSKDNNEDLGATLTINLLHISALVLFYSFQYLNRPPVWYQGPRFHWHQSTSAFALQIICVSLPAMLISISTVYIHFMWNGINEECPHKVGWGYYMPTESGCRYFVIVGRWFAVWYQFTMVFPVYFSEQSRCDEY